MAEYVTCKHPRCRPFAGGLKSWKYVELLPAACKYCGHNFQHHSIRQPRKSAEPHPAPKSSRLSSDTNPSQLSDEDFALLVKQRVGGDGDKAALVDQIFPPGLIILSG